MKKNFLKCREPLTELFFPKKEDSPDQFPSVVIGVDDINEPIQKVTQAKGTVLGEPDEILGIGKYISFIDTESNRVSQLQPIM
jgi:uncharacterized protein